MRRMLIVDDERDICDCLQQYFSAHGFTVSAAFSGEEALERLKEDTADIILLDILLPGLSGIEVLKHIRHVQPEARIIMVSGLDHPDVRAQAHYYGAEAYITKPFDFSDATWSAVFADPSAERPTRI